MNQSIYDIPIKSIDGDENILSDLKGKVTLFFPLDRKSVV
jgi:hypothetical protein